WGYPCESKSSPAFKSKHPLSEDRGCFFMGIKEWGKGGISKRTLNHKGLEMIFELLQEIVAPPKALPDPIS
ncbi:hypothetical protein, partial [Acinetobacter defluvii]|uniref:hypothetical protein n=1 Tax=Acinetobacter defluvii TaxID=1871111 RepID=UPI003AF9623D